MKRVSALLMFSALAACSHYGSSGDIKEVGSRDTPFGVMPRLLTSPAVMSHLRLSTGGQPRN